jgi:hypothetical protein
METYVVRVWLPDRPGALGQVASRIGAVRGDVVGIEILERGGGRAIDELVVEVPGPEVVELLISEIHHVDGVAVEDVRPADGVGDSRLDALESAAVLVGAPTPGILLAALAAQARADFGAAWAAVVDLTEPVVVAGEGAVPPVPWLAAFVEGGRASDAVTAGRSGPDDVAWAPMEAAQLEVVVGRHGRPLRGRERLQLGALARIADTRWREVSIRASRLIHPSNGG